MVVIKNFEIPDNCLFCKCYQDDRCVFLNEWNCVSGIKRLDNCPLKTHVTCKNCKNQYKDSSREWALKCSYYGEYVSEDWYCKAGRAREVTDE